MRKSTGVFAVMVVSAIAAPAGADFASNISAAVPDTLGQIAGNMGATASPEEWEKRCLAGQPMPEPAKAAVIQAATREMEKYFKLAAKKSPRLKSMLRDKDEGAHWIGPQGEADLEKLRDPYLADPTHSAPELKEIVVSGNFLTVRAIYSLTVQKPDDATARQRIEYGFDILHSYWSAYKIWHVHVYVEPDTAPVPAANCRFDPATAY